MLVAGALVFAGQAEAAPSFDCAAAMLPIELALCGDAALGDLEGEMTRLYQQRLAAADSATADRLQRDMRRWLRQLTQDCEVPRSGSFGPDAIERASPCLQQKYRDQIAALQPPAEAVEPAAAEVAPATDAEAGAAEQAAADEVELVPAAGPEVAALPPQPAPQGSEGANTFAWQAAPFGDGLVAIIARIDEADEYATASVYCDSQYAERVPVFLYRLGGSVPEAAEVERLNRSLEGAALVVDGEQIQSVGREDLGKRFSGLQLLPDGTLSYMLLIDPAKLEAILHGRELQAVLHLPGSDAGPYAAETFPLKNSRRAIEAAMQRCISVAGSVPPA